MAATRSKRASRRREGPASIARWEVKQIQEGGFVAKVWVRQSQPCTSLQARDDFDLILPENGVCVPCKFKTTWKHRD